MSIRKYYKNEIVCDVVDIDVCHLLLGRSWHIDVDPTLCDRDNVYKFVKDDKKITLLPKKESEHPVVSPTGSSKSAKNLLIISFSEEIFFAYSNASIEVQEKGVEESLHLDYTHNSWSSFFKWEGMMWSSFLENFT